MVLATVSFDDVVEQLRDEVGCDTATLLLLDDSGEVLEPAASAGLGRLWRGATHVRVGTGFAGRVARERAPVLLNEVKPTTVLNPILRDSGVQTLLGVPVQSGGRLLGVLHVGSRLPDREFTAGDVNHLTLKADQIASRLSAHTGTDEHTAALALQRSLLPAVPPMIPGLDMAVRYLPSEGDLGGDWYDVFALPGGRVGLVMGDVQGHGLHAAIVMGRLRSALRAYALEHEDPAVVLQLLDRKLSHFETDMLATVAYATTEPPFDRVLISLAGHPPPIAVHPGDAEAEVLSLPTGLLLGVASDTVRASHSIELHQGTVIALHTDGLTDLRPPRNAPPDHDAHASRLARVCAAFRPDTDAETACASIIASALGNDSLEDDVALLVLRRT